MKPIIFVTPTFPNFPLISICEGVLELTVLQNTKTSPALGKIPVPAKFYPDARLYKIIKNA